MKLPTILTEESRFYKNNEEACKPHLGKPYISYSTIDSWINYREDFIKSRFVGIPFEGNVYTAMGSYLGGIVETGDIPTDDFGFTGQENISLIPRPENAEYEKFVLIDMGKYIFLGFIDVFYEVDGGVALFDLKTGGAYKEDQYKSSDYLQVPLYAYALEKAGYNVVDTSVWFVRRTGSHINPPLNISEEQFRIPVEYDEKIGEKAVEVMNKTVKEISSVYKTYIKIFK